MTLITFIISEHFIHGNSIDDFNDFDFMRMSFTGFSTQILINGVNHLCH